MEKLWVQVKLFWRILIYISCDQRCCLYYKDKGFTKNSKEALLSVYMTVG